MRSIHILGIWLTTSIMMGGAVHAGPSFSFDTPQGWVKESPQSKMRLAQFRLPGQDNQGDGELAVFSFPGGGGSVQANLNRWYEQFENAEGEKHTSHDEKKELKTKKGVPITWVRLTGTFLKSRSPMMTGPVDRLPGYGMLGAIIETKPNPYFVKATGPQPTMERWQEAFANFVQSFEFN